MGSWNSGCFLTHTPIQEGDPVVGLFLLPIDSPRSARRAGHAHRFTPVGLPFRGTYDGYGWLVPGAAPRDHRLPLAALDMILAAGAFVEPSRDAQDSSAFEAGVLDLPGVHDLAHAGRLVAKVPEAFAPDGKARLVTTLCHAAAWDLLAQRPLTDDEDTFTPEGRVAALFSLLDALHGRRGLPPSSDGLEGLDGWEVLLEPARVQNGLRATASLHYGPLLDHLRSARFVLDVGRDPDHQHSWKATARLLAEVVHVHAQMLPARRFWAPGPGIEAEDDWTILHDLAQLAFQIARDGQRRADA